jgi:hypothetical protein
MKQLIAITTIIAMLLTSGCHNPGNNDVGKHPATEPENILVSNIELRPNPYHLWPNTNFKPGVCSVIVTVINNGKGTFGSKLFFTLKLIKDDGTGNFNSPAKSIGGATLTDGLLPNETKYVTIPYDAWLSLATAQGDFTSVLGTYKIVLELSGSDHITQDIPQPLLQVVSGG